MWGQMKKDILILKEKHADIVNNKHITALSTWTEKNSGDNFDSDKYLEKVKKHGKKLEKIFLEMFN
jgi:hypothetical protein